MRILRRRRVHHHPADYDMFMLASEVKAQPSALLAWIQQNYV